PPDTRPASAWVSPAFRPALRFATRYVLAISRCYEMAGRKREHLTRAERQKAYRERKAERAARGVGTVDMEARASLPVGKVEQPLADGEYAVAERELRKIAGKNAPPADVIPANAPAWDFGREGYDPVSAMVARAIDAAETAHQLLPSKQPGITEEQYVELSLLQAGPFDSRERRIRAERYARWR